LILLCPAAYCENVYDSIKLRNIPVKSEKSQI
jgi:hypothetical protein